MGSCCENNRIVDNPYRVKGESSGVRRGKPCCHDLPFPLDPTRFASPVVRFYFEFACLRLVASPSFDFALILAALGSKRQSTGALLMLAAHLYARRPLVILKQSM